MSLQEANTCSLNIGGYDDSFTSCQDTSVMFVTGSYVSGEVSIPEFADIQEIRQEFGREWNGSGEILKDGGTV